MRYRYETVITGPDHSCPYEMTLRRSDGRLIGSRYVFSLSEGREKARKMAKKDAADRTGEVVDEGVIDLTSKKRWWRR